MKKLQKGAVVLWIILAVIALVVIGIYYAWSNNSLVEVQYRESNTVVKNETIPEEIKLFYMKYNDQDYNGMADMFDSLSVKNNFQSREGLISYLKFNREAYGRNNNYSLVQTHKAIKPDNQFVYEVKSTYQNVTLVSNDTFTMLVDKTNSKILLKNFSPGVSKELR